MASRICTLVLLSCVAMGAAFVGPRLTSCSVRASALVHRKFSCNSCASTQTRRRGRSPVMYAGGEGVGDEGVDDDEDEEMDDEAVVNGVMQMKISEIKAELDMREVSYAGLTTKGELAKMLLAARHSGIADPSILDLFNRETVEQLVDPQTGEFEEDLGLKEQMRGMTAGDGTLPGGLTPEQLKGLVSNPELMRTMQNPKMQALLKKAMERGAESVMDSFKNDPEMDEMLEKATKEIESLKFFRGI